MEMLGSLKTPTHVLNALHYQIVSHATCSQKIVSGVQVLQPAENGIPFFARILPLVHVMFMTHAVNVLPIQVVYGVVKETELAPTLVQIALCLLTLAHVTTTPTVLLV